MKFNTLSRLTEPILLLYNIKPVSWLFLQKNVFIAIRLSNVNGETFKQFYFSNLITILCWKH